MAKVEQLGAEGNVEESQKVMDEVEKARAKKREAEVKFVCLGFFWSCFETRSYCETQPS